MQKKRPVSAYLITFLIAITAAFVAYKTLHQISFYSANPAFLTTLLISRDSVTLFIGVPLLIITGLMALRESNRGYLAWLGVQAYFLGTYFWYSCGIAYNRFFLIYLILFAGSLFSFIRTLLALDAEIFSLRFSSDTPVRWIAAFMFIGGLALAYQWLNPILRDFGIKQPVLLSLYGPAMMVNPLLNLGIVTPTALLAGIWIWKRKPWGYIAAGILLFYGLTICLAFLTSQWIVYNRGEIIDGNSTMLFGVITFAILILWSIFLKNLKEETLRDHHNQITSL